MNWTPVDRALFWKESRQVLPLFLSVLGLWLVLVLLAIIAQLVFNKELNYSLGLFIGPPIIFATGVGVLLVGNEKDQRTLGWFQSLPISPWRIARTKLAVAIGSVLLIWLVSFLLDVVLTAIFGNLRSLLSDNPRDGILTVAMFVAVSIFIALTGLATAWKLNSSLFALLSLVPIGIAVWIAAVPVGRLILGAETFEDPAYWYYLLTLAVGSIAAVAYGWRASLKALGPQAVPRPLWGQTANRAELQTAAVWERPIQPAVSALLWQNAIQNRWLWLALAAMLLLGTWATVIVPYEFNGSIVRSIDEALVQLGILIGCLAACWIGVFAYQGDRMHQRIRFLADRGVSPTRVWWTRHWIPAVIILAAGLLRFALRPGQAWGVDELPSVVTYDFFRFLGIAFGIYGVSQWASHWLRSPIIAAVLVPLVTLMVGVFAIFALELFEAPAWLLGVSVLVLFFATWFQAKAWMDGSWNWKYYAKHAGFLAIALVLPLIPGLWRIATMPSIDSNLKQTLTKLSTETTVPGAELPMARSATTDLPLHPRDFYVSSTLHSVGLAYAANEELRASMLQRIAEGAPGWFGLDPRSGLESLLGRLESTRQALSETRSEAELETAKTEYRQLMSFLIDWVVWKRMALDLRSQNHSETIEIAILGECLHPVRRQAMGEELYQRAAKLLTDSATRDAYRQRVLARAWVASVDANRQLSTIPAERYQFKKGIPYFSSLYMRSSNNPVTAISMAQSRAMPDLMATKYWELLRCEPGEAATKPQEIAKWFEDYGLPSDVYDSVIYLDRMGWAMTPNWRGEWERQAKRLPTVLPETSNASVASPSASGPTSEGNTP